MNERSKLFDSVIISSWWVILYLLALFFLYDQASNKRNREVQRLHQKYAVLQLQKDEIKAHLEEFQLRKASQGDPLWTELLLREKLGLVGENETKVMFQ